MWQRSIAAALLLLCAFTAAAADRGGKRAEPQTVFEAQAPLDDEALDDLRGRLAAPRELQQVGVVLWDEPRPGVPPARGGAAPEGAPQLTVNVTYR